MNTQNQQTMPTLQEELKSATAEAVERAKLDASLQERLGRDLILLSQKAADRLL
jgi:hypothetical protein